MFLAPLSSIASTSLTLIQYRLDDDSECFNPKEPNTASCPLLPGQYVNVLDVPIQQSYPDSTRNASLVSLTEQVFTLNPADKFATPCPPTPSQARPCSPPRVYSASSGTQGESALSKMARWTREFRVHSRPTSSHLMRFSSVLPRHCPSEPSQRTAATFDYLQKPKRPLSAPVDFKAWEPSRNATSKVYNEGAGVVEDSMSLDFEALSIRSAKDIVRIKADPSLGPLESSDGGDPAQSHSQLNSRHLVEQPDLEIKERTFHNKSRVNSYDVSLDEFAEPQLRSKPTAYATRQDLDFGTANSSKRTSGVFSVSESMAACTDYASPQNRYSQPMTPSVSEFGEFLLDAFHLEDSGPQNLSTENSSQPPNRFSGYNLPEAQHASAITLRAEPSSRSKRPTLDSTFENKQLVQNWNDGREHHKKSALQDLVDEMGYLSSLID